MFCLVKRGKSKKKNALWRFCSFLSIFVGLLPSKVSFLPNRKRKWFAAKVVPSEDTHSHHRLMFGSVETFEFLIYAVFLYHNNRHHNKVWMIIISPDRCDDISDVLLLALNTSLKYFAWRESDLKRQQSAGEIFPLFVCFLYLVCLNLLWKMSVVTNGRRYKEKKNADRVKSARGGRYEGGLILVCACRERKRRHGCGDEQEESNCV